MNAQVAARSPHSGPDLISADSLHIALAGDVMLGDSSVCVGWGMGSVHAPEPLATHLQAAASTLRSADLAFGNLETPLCERGVGSTRWTRDQMRASPAAAHALRHAGFSALSVTNNHAVQHGAEGFWSTVDALEAAGISPVGIRGTDGWACAPVRLPVKGRTLGLLAYCWRPRQYGETEPPFAEGSPDEAIADVQRLRETTDAVIVSLHWGDEFCAQPSEAQVDIGRALIAAGAHVVFGHHPHVTQPVEAWGRGVIAYSLGNFCSDMLWMPATSEGIIVRVALHAQSASLGAITPCTMTPDYRVQIGATRSADALRPLAAEPYARQVRDGLTSQRRHAYAYVVQRLHRFPASVLAELLGRTVSNKVKQLWPSKA